MDLGTTNKDKMQGTLDPAGKRNRRDAKKDKEKQNESFIFTFLSSR